MRVSKRPIVSSYKPRNRFPSFIYGQKKSRDENLFFIHLKVVMSCDLYSSDILVDKQQLQDNFPKYF